MDQTASSAFSDFERVRGRLFGLAYRMVGSRAEAEDIVQEAYLRWHQADRRDIRSAEAWLVTTTTRVAIDRLRALKTARDAYPGPWLPEPLMRDVPPPPDYAAEIASDLSIAFLFVLERLGPEERAAFLLHDVFDCSYQEVARVLGKTEATCRQMVRRARERVRSGRRRFMVTESAKADLLRRFKAAMESRDEQALFELLAPEATWTADGGGRVPATPRPLVGADRIVRLVLGLQQRFSREQAILDLDLGTVNGETALLIRVNGRLTSVLSIETDGERILAAYAVVNPDKLGASTPVM